MYGLTGIDSEEENDGGEFEIHLNEEVVGEISGGKSVEEFAEQFAAWNPDEETSREFKPQDIEALLAKIEQDDSTVQVIGFNEFPYTAGNKLKGSNREVEREYWLHLRNVDKRIAGDDNLAILHVHYKGKWHPVPRNRDRSVISQVNIRHTAKTREKAFHMKCADLNKWREKHGSSVLRQIPKDGWRWRDDGSRCRAVQKVLMGAERCTKQVRSLDVLGKDLKAGSGLRRALIIAVKKYDCEKIPDLANAIQDGAKLEGKLQQLGWEVELETNLGRADAWTKISEFVKSVEDNADACLFAFVGHGIEVNGKQYLVPRDARLGEREFLSHADFEQELQAVCLQFDSVRILLGEARDASEPTIFVLDCCRNDFCKVRGHQTRSLPQAQKPSAGVVTEVENSIIVFSTTSGNTAEDGPAGEGGPFMSVFVEEIGKEGRDLDEALMNTRKRVRDASSNCQLAPSTSLLYGKFFFNPAPPTTAEPRPPLARSDSAGDVLQRFVSDDAREFWRTNFHQDEEVGWSSFSVALQTEFPELGPAALAEVRLRVDHDGDGRVHAREFNIFTKKAGLCGQVQAVVRQCEAGSASGPTTAGVAAAAVAVGGDRSLPTSSTLASAPVETSAPSPVSRADSFSDSKASERVGEPGVNEGQRKVDKPASDDDPVQPLLATASADITYLGTGAVLGGQKLRHGTVELGGCWVTVVRERGDTKDPLNMADCTVLRTDKIDAGRTLEIVPSKGKNVVFSMATAAERDRWFEALSLCKRLAEEARQVSAVRFSEIVGDVAPMGRHQLVCTATNTLPESVAHAVGKLPLTAAQPYFEVLVRALGTGDRVTVSLGLSAGPTGRRRGHAGWLAGELGLHSDDGCLFVGNSRPGLPFIPGFGPGDRVGCGAFFAPGAQVRGVYFTKNGEVLGTVPSSALHPLVAVTGRGTRVDVMLGLPPPPAAADFARRCRVEGAGGAESVFGSLAEAVGAASDGGTVTLGPGRYYLTETLELGKAVTVRALERGAAEIVKHGGGVAVSSKAGSAVLSGLVIRCEGGDVRVKASEPGSAVAVAVTVGSCRLEDCAVSCPRGSALCAFGGSLACAGCSVGPCGRSGVVVFKSGYASVDSTVVERCGKFCAFVNGGGKLDLVGCTIRSKADAVLITANPQDGGATLSLTGSELTAQAATGAAVAARGEKCAATVVGCGITGFGTAAAADGRGSKVSLRDCRVARCGRAFSARADATVVRVDCALDAVERPDETADGGRVVDV